MAKPSTGRGAQKTIVLVGAGHAHLHAIARTADYVRAGHALVVVSGGRFWYSGMGPGLLSGRYSAEDDTVDVASIVQAQGGRFIDARVERIDPAAQEIELSNGSGLDYTHVSLNVGSDVPAAAIPGASDHAVPVKPVSNLLDLAIRWRSHPPQSVVVIGGGAAGCEVAANVRAAHEQTKIALVESGARLLDGLPARAARLMLEKLTQAGIDVHLETRVTAVDPQHVSVDQGDAIPADSCIVATGVRPPALASQSGLRVDGEGALIVDSHLRSVSHPNVLGGGDCVQLQGHALDRVGVYAVRQAPILHHNLLALASGRELQRFVPQDRYLIILNLGDGTGLLSWRGWTFRARWAMALKHWLDRRFMTPLQRLARQGS